MSRTDLTASLIIHEENTNEIMTVKEFVYLMQNHADIHIYCGLGMCPMGFIAFKIMEVQL